MTTAQLVFLYAAEELNITRAAQRAFVSQQCASAHIRNLEDHYGISLFARKPSLSLTPAGESLYRAYREMYLMEQNTEMMMEEVRSGAVGQLRMGGNSSRSRVLVPEILARYGEDFPGVTVVFEFGDTRKLLDELRAGNLDVLIAIGLTPEDTEGLDVIPLVRDAVHFLTTPAQIRKYAPEFPKKNAEGDISLHSIVPFPMCRNRKHSTLTHLVDRSLAREGVTLRDRYFISDYDTQLALCMNNVASCFCPAMLLPHMREMSRHQAPENRILDFRVREIEETLTVDLVQMKYSFRPVYIRRFVSYLREAVEHVTGTSLL